MVFSVARFMKNVFRVSIRLLLRMLFMFDCGSGKFVSIGIRIGMVSMVVNVIIGVF